MAVENRLRHARFAGDLGGRRAAVAALGEDPAGGVEHRRTALHGREARTSGAHAGSAAKGSSTWRSWRTSVSATIAATKAIPAATCRAAWKPSTNCPGKSGLRGPTLM